MYKIMYRVLTEQPNIFAFWGYKDEEDNFIVYEYERESEVKEAAKKLIEKVGVGDVRIVLDEDYYLKIIMGIKPEPIEHTFDIQLSGSSDVIIEPNSFENVEKGSTLVSSLTFKVPVQQFHLLVDGAETDLGVLDWISYKSIDATHGELTLSDITKDHTIVVIIDKIKEGSSLSV